MYIFLSCLIISMDDRIYYADGVLSIMGPTSFRGGGGLRYFARIFSPARQGPANLISTTKDNILYSILVASVWKERQKKKGHRKWSRFPEYKMVLPESCECYLCFARICHLKNPGGGGGGHLVRLWTCMFFYVFYVMWYLEFYFVFYDKKRYH